MWYCGMPIDGCFALSQLQVFINLYNYERNVSIFTQRVGKIQIISGNISFREFMGGIYINIQIKVKIRKN